MNSRTWFRGPRWLSGSLWIRCFERRGLRAHVLEVQVLCFLSRTGAGVCPLKETLQSRLDRCLNRASVGPSELHDTKTYGNGTRWTLT